MMQNIGEPIIESTISHDVRALEFAYQVGYPVIVRLPTLWGTGGGMANNPNELKAIAGWHTLQGSPGFTRKISGRI